jgi:hypothetical protein
MMINDNPAAKKANGYINAKRGEDMIFQSDRVDVHPDATWLEIQGTKNLGFPGWSGIFLTINRFTQSGEQVFLPGGEYLRRVRYAAPDGKDVYAQSGTFEARLNNATKKYQITFNLSFPSYGEIQGDVDVTE